MKQEFDDHGRGYWFLADLDKRLKGSAAEAAPGSWVDHETREPALREDANLISSKTITGSHKPVLDFDFGCRLVPSTTPGHFHLYIDKAVSETAYFDLLRAMANAGLLESGFAEASIRRGATFVRPSWVKKPEKA